jgi:hypothetical protein
VLISAERAMERTFDEKKRATTAALIPAAVRCPRRLCGRLTAHTRFGLPCRASVSHFKTAGR